MCHANFYVPQLYPRELLASGIARGAFYYNVRQRKTLNLALFGQASLTLSYLLPSRLDRLRWLTEGVWHMSAEEVTLKHTVLPFYLSAISDDKQRSNVIHKVVTDQASQLYKTLGLTRSMVSMPEVLRYCPACVVEDRHSYGETYWRVEHQLPGVFVCADHELPLRHSKARLQPSRCAPPLAADPTVDLVNDANEPVPAADLQRAVEFARCARDRLYNKTRVDHRRWIIKLAERGFTGGRGKLEQLQARFVEYWGIGFLRLVEADWDGVSSLGWLQRIRHNRQKGLHPSRQLLLDKFLASISLTTEDDAFGVGPWLCPNWLAPHHRQKVITAYEDVSDHRHPERTIRRFHCDCGFTFTRHAGSEDDDYRIVDFGPLFYEDAKKLAALGLRTHSVAKALNVDWATADRFLKTDSVTLVCDVTGRTPKCSDKAKWLALVDQHPDENCNSLRAREPALYARLYRTNRDWLLAHPVRRVGPAASHDRVDWGARDVETERMVRIAVNQLHALSPRKRITQTALLSHLGCQSTIEKNIWRLPLTRSTLDEVCENWEQFRLRRLKDAVRALGKDAPQWRIIRYAALRPEKLDNKMLESAGLQPDSAGANDAHG